MEEAQTLFRREIRCCRGGVLLSPSHPDCHRHTYAATVLTLVMAHGSLTQQRNSLTTHSPSPILDHVDRLASRFLPAQRSSEKKKESKSWKIVQPSFPTLIVDDNWRRLCSAQPCGLWNHISDQARPISSRVSNVVEPLSHGYTSALDELKNTRGQVELSLPAAVRWS